jgi:predicted peptidase
MRQSALELKFLIGMIVLTMIISGCGGQSEMPVGQPETGSPNTATPSPLPTKGPTATHTLSPPPTPSSTPTDAPMPTPSTPPTSSPAPVPPTDTPTLPTDIPPTATSVVRVGQHPYSSEVQVVDTNHNTQTVKVEYLLYLPDTYGKDPQQKWPLILFLHGSGEQGKDLELLRLCEFPKLLDQQTDFPFIVVSPLLPLEANRWWSDRIDALTVLLDQIQAAYAVDATRTYVTGLSAGGFGTWEFALRYPKRFAAIVPIAGGYRYGSDLLPENICDLKDVSVWAFHGAQDNIVLPSQTEIMVDTLQACGGEVRFTLYSEANHEDSWRLAYADPELYEWLLEQSLQ